jgi:hypothetical protein
VIAALILLLPLRAMQFTDEVVWDEADFAVMAAMLFGACGAYEMAARMTGNIQCHQVSRCPSFGCARLNEVAAVVYISYEHGL